MTVTLDVSAGRFPPETVDAIADIAFACVLDQDPVRYIHGLNRLFPALTWTVTEHTADEMTITVEEA